MTCSTTCRTAASVSGARSGVGEFNTLGLDVDAHQPGEVLAEDAALVDLGQRRVTPALLQVVGDLHVEEGLEVRLRRAVQGGLRAPQQLFRAALLEHLTELGLELARC